MCTGSWLVDWRRPQCRWLWSLCFYSWGFALWSRREKRKLCVQLGESTRQTSWSNGGGRGNAGEGCLRSFQREGTILAMSLLRPQTVFLLKLCARSSRREKLISCFGTMEGKCFLKCIACIVKFIDIPHDIIHDLGLWIFNVSSVLFIGLALHTIFLRIKTYFFECKLTRS